MEELFLTETGEAIVWMQLGFRRMKSPFVEAAVS
jgi:hypothetical protein